MVVWRKNLVVVCAVLCSFGFTTLPAADVKLPTLPRGKGEACVEPTDLMRKQHMDFLHHQRDETVYNGIRTKRHSLHECVSCHAQKDAADEFIPVNAAEQFCQSCHAFVSVKLDCFECHASRPDKDVVRSQSGHMPATTGWFVLQSDLINAYQTLGQ